MGKKHDYKIYKKKNHADTPKEVEYSESWIPGSGKGFSWKISSNCLTVISVKDLKSNGFRDNLLYDSK